MRITLRELRHTIREEVERNMRWSAGIAPMGIGHGSVNKSTNQPLPGLGDETEEECEKNEEERQ